MLAASAERRGVALINYLLLSAGRATTTEPKFETKL
jgi:hypothetical protein